MFENATNTITLKPDSRWVKGRTYYYTVTVKESNSDSVKNSFFCNVTITGEPLDLDNMTICDPDSLNQTEICDNIYESSCDVTCEYSDTIKSDDGDCYCDGPPIVDDLYVYEMTAKNALHLTTTMAMILTTTTYF